MPGVLAGTEPLGEAGVQRPKLDDEIRCHKQSAQGEGHVSAKPHPFRGQGGSANPRRPDLCLALKTRRVILALLKTERPEVPNCHDGANRRRRSSFRYFSVPRAA
jgi:hypothetical protein